MASYSKQMVEIAKEWVATNPNPDQPLIKVPGVGSHHDSAATERAHLERYEKIAKRRPDLAPLVGELRSTVEQIHDTLDGLDKSELDLSVEINRPLPAGNSKYSLDGVKLRADIGRWCLAWARNGYNVFELSPDFTAAMLLTDAREIDVESVQLPFGGLLMLIPDGFAVGADGGSYTKVHVSEYSESSVNERAAAMRVVDTIDKLNEAQRREVLSNALKFGVAGGNHPLLSKHDDANTEIDIYATDGRHALTTVIRRAGLTWSTLDELPDATEEADQAARRTIRQIVFGALAYMTAVETATTLREPSKRPKAGGKVETGPRIFEVGRTIKLDPQLVRAARGGSREVALRLKHRHIVRGHYRNQAHGAGRADRRRIWIAPHWKGPEDGAELVHTYKLEGSL